MYVFRHISTSLLSSTCFRGQLPDFCRYQKYCTKILSWMYPLDFSETIEHRNTNGFLTFCEDGNKAIPSQLSISKSSVDRRYSIASTHIAIANHISSSSQGSNLSNLQLETKYYDQIIIFRKSIAS